MLANCKKWKGNKLFNSSSMMFPTLPVDTTQSFRSDGKIHTAEVSTCD